MKKSFHNVVIIGTGCAGYGCAFYLDKLGVKDVIVACENKNFGTSRNTGSDKQTYYKLSLCGDEEDSVRKMAHQFYEYGGVSGENALCEAANSAECFFNLVSLGVPFPKNEFGEYVGYQTDHDNCKRATSAGPLTSKYMVEALENEVMSRKIAIYENLIPIKIIIKDNKAIGCMFVNKNEPEIIFCNHLVFATGGEASLFHESVYPQSQFGALGVLIDAGVRLRNFNHWQFGIASTAFRWNLSGSYQQVIPRYIRINESGEQAEFLRNSLTDEDIYELTFCKGYEWPFDSKKRDKSSLIDILVKQQTDFGNKVYLDYTTNPEGFSIDRLSDSARNYLIKSNAIGKTPIERLRQLNMPSYNLYLAHNIDLTKQMLQIAVCAQHQNGGAAVDENYQTNIENLFVIGEAAGIFSAYRPGGAALNSTQVGAMRCAEKISSNIGFKFDINIDCEKHFAPFKKFNSKIDLSLYKKWQNKNSEICGIIRDNQKIKAEIPKLKTDIVACSDYKTREMLISSLALYESCVYAGENIGSFGSAIYKCGKDFVKENDEQKNKILIYENGICSLVEPTPIPQSEQWFEAVWQTRQKSEREL